jgi:hypothetical protein
MEVAPALALSAGIPLTPRLALVVTSEHLYWTGITLGESRLSIGLSARPHDSWR